MFNELVLSGGGIKGIAMIGALSYLEDIHLLKNIKRYVGTSVGGFISFLLVVGFNCDELKKIAINLDFDNYSDITLSNLFNDYGLDSFNKIMRIIIAIIKQKNINKDITFKELYKITKKKLIITGSNISKSRIELFSKTTTPSMRVLDALQITMSIPFMFKPVLYNDNYYVDGGLYDPYPIKYAKNLNKTIGIFLKKNENFEKNIVINSLSSYIFQVLKCYYDEFKERIITKKKYKKCTIIVDAEMVVSVNLKLDMINKKNIMDIGRKASNLYIENVFNEKRLQFLIKKYYLNRYYNRNSIAYQNSLQQMS